MSTMEVTMRRTTALAMATPKAMATAKPMAMAIMKGPIEVIMRGPIVVIMRGAIEATMRMATEGTTRKGIRVTVKKDTRDTGKMDTRDLVRRFIGGTMRLAIEIPMKASMHGRTSTIILDNGNTMNCRWDTLPKKPFARELQLPTQWRIHLRRPLLGCTRWRGCWSHSKKDWSIYRY